MVVRAAMENSHISHVLHLQLHSSGSQFCFFQDCLHYTLSLACLWPFPQTYSWLQRWACASLTHLPRPFSNPIFLVQVIFFQDHCTLWRTPYTLHLWAFIFWLVMPALLPVLLSPKWQHVSLWQGMCAHQCIFFPLLESSARMNTLYMICKLPWVIGIYMGEVCDLCEHLHSPFVGSG